MKPERIVARAVCAVLIGLAVVQAGAARAATFSVNPTQVYLSTRATTALVTLRNESSENLRFQLSVFAWDQAADGEMKLAATQDVVFFPQMLTLAPGEERKIRVGSLRPATDVEKTYRLFVEELPPSQAEDKAGTVKVLTKMGIPIFLRNADEPPRGELRELAVAGGRLAFTLANKGRTHFVPDSVVVRALAASGETVGEQQVKSWYILANSVRVFDVELPKTPVASLAVEVKLPGASAPLVQRIDVRDASPRQ